MYYSLKRNDVFNFYCLTNYAIIRCRCRLCFLAQILLGNTIECLLRRLQASLQKDSSSFAQRQMVSTWIIYCSRNNLPVLSDVLRQMASNEETQRVNFNWKYHWHSVNLDSDSLDSNPMFTGSKIRIWICRKEREIRFKI